MLPTTRLLRPARPGLRHLLQSLILAVAAALVPASAAVAEKGLPKPYVSPALDAVLLPITAEVRKEFKLGKKAAGLVIVSVDPGGVGELYGLEPGEVITELDDKALRRPVDLDSMIRYKLKAGTNYFFFEGTWKNKKKKTIIDFSDVTIQGELTKPEGSYSVSKKKTTFRTLIKVRDGLAKGDYRDPGWYAHPSGTIASRVSTNPDFGNPVRRNPARSR